MGWLDGGRGVLVDVRWGEMVHLENRFALENLLGWSGGSDGTVQKNECLSVLGNVLNIVGGAKEGKPPGSLQVADLAVELRPCRWIQARSGLVQNQKAGLSHQRPRDEDSLFLSARKVLEPTPHKMGSPYLFQHLLHQGPVGPGRTPAESQVPKTAHQDHIPYR
jgi:hypothetical protein